MIFHNLNNVLWSGCIVKYKEDGCDLSPQYTFKCFVGSDIEPTYIFYNSKV